MSTKEKLRTLVALCSDLGGPGRGLDLKELRSSLESGFPGISVEVVTNLCGHLGQLSLGAAGECFGRAVLGLCSRDYSQIELQSWARKAGLDPFGVEVVPLGTLCAAVHPNHQATWKAGVLLAAALARAHAFDGSRPEHAKPYFLPRDQKVSRRTLFTIPPIGYRSIPSIRRDLCASAAGCELCARACPRRALRRTGGRLILSKALCEGCGVCLAACPNEAIEFPGWSLSQLEAQLASLLNSTVSGPEAIGLLLVCEKAAGTLEELAHQRAGYSHQWLPMSVPCLGMVTPTWLLQALAQGAEAVALLSCGTDCPYGQEQTIGGRVNFCRRLLRLLGHAPDRVRALSASQPERLLQALRRPLPQKDSFLPGRKAEDLHLGTVAEAFTAIKCLAREGSGYSGAVLEHPYSPFGLVELEAQSCTACLSCVRACPTGALVSGSSAQGLTLTFAAPLCTGCGLCVESCPEAPRALQVRQTTDLSSLADGRVVIRQDELAQCRACGAIIAPRSLLQHVGTKLEGSNEALHMALNHYCSSCRLTLTWGAEPIVIHQEEGM